jgi:predicted amidophosphoribosyltransferase
MQFQIECKNLTNSQFCVVCNQQFQTKDARLIVCSSQGDSYGDVCPECVSRGANWIKSQLHQFSSKLKSTS